MSLSSTRLSVFCSKLIEAGWLAAAVVVPLYFNVYSSRVFEPDKIAILRSIAVLMLAAWLIKSIEEISHGQQVLRFSWCTPLVLPALAIIVVYLLTTLTSVTPHASLWGSYQRLQGAYTCMACIAIFFLILNEMSSREQFDRLMTVVILTSVPISLYGLIQHYRLDSLPWGGDAASRITATMGNPTFLAAYQLMIFFLTVGRVAEGLVACLSGEEGRVINIVRLAIYTLITITQFAAIWFTGSRGAWIGWMAGVFTFVWLGLLKLRYTWPNWRAWKWLGLSWIVLGILVVAFLIVVNLPDSPLAPVLKSPYRRIFQTLDVGTGEGKVHTIIWEGAVQLVGWHDPILWPGDKIDALNAVRPFIGYGPESMYVTYGRFYPLDLAHYEVRNALPDRAFNVVFDTLITTGALGLLAYLFLVSSVFYCGSQWLGWIGSNRDRAVWWTLWLGGGALGMIVPLILQRSNFFGVGLLLGMIGGLIIYLAGHALKTPRDHRWWIKLAALLSTVLAHLVEISSGVVVAATYLYFWVYVGLLVVLGTRLSIRSTTIQASESQTTGQGSHPDHARFSLPVWLVPVLVYALTCALVLATLSYEFITNADRLVDPIGVVWRALTTIPIQGFRASYAVLGMFVLTWLAGGLVTFVESGRDKALRTSKSLVGGVLVYCVASVSLAAVFALSLALFLGGFTQVRTSTIDQVVQISEQVTRVLDYYYGYVFLVIFGIGGLLMVKSHPPGIPPASRVGVVLILPVLVLAWAIIIYTNLNPIRADVMYKQASPWDYQRQWDASIAHYKRAIELAPTEDFYYLWLGRALLEKANQVKNDEGLLFAEQISADAVLKMDTGQIARLCQQDLLIAVEAVLVRAREINPLNSDHSANLARLYRRWADLAQTPEEKQRHAEQSIRHYQDAIHLNPNNVVLWNEWAVVYLELTNDPETALQRLNHSLELDDRFAQTYVLLGDLYLDQKKLDKAIEAYRDALEIAPQLTRALYSLCPIYVQQNELDEAIACNQDLVQVAPHDWNAYQALASVLDQKGELEQALSSAQAARRLAPKEQQPTLDMYIVQLQTRLAQPLLLTPVPK